MKYSNITINWDYNPEVEVDEFVIYRSESESEIVNDDNIIGIVDKNTFQFIDTKVYSHTNYFYIIGAKKSDQISHSNTIYAISGENDGNVIMRPKDLNNIIYLDYNTEVYSENDEVISWSDVNNIITFTNTTDIKPKITPNGIKFEGGEALRVIDTLRDIKNNKYTFILVGKINSYLSGSLFSANRTDSTWIASFKHNTTNVSNHGLDYDIDGKTMSAIYLNQIQVLGNFMLIIEYGTYNNQINYSYYVNGMLYTSNKEYISSVDIYGFDKITLFSSNSKADIEVKAFIFDNKILSKNNRDIQISTLAHYYSMPEIIPSDNPYKNSPPLKEEYDNTNEQ